MDEIQAMADTQPEVSAEDTPSVAQACDTSPSAEETFTDSLAVKFNKQTVTLSREDATRYAQKGMKYDSVEPLLATLKGVAAREGKSLAAWVEGVAEADAVSQAGTESRPHEPVSGDEGDALAARLAEDYLILRREVPEVGGFDTLPPDALREAAESGISLLDAYLRHEHRERCRVAAEQAAQAAAAGRSIGSQAAGAAPEASTAERAMLRGVWG